ncbi:coiled-coil domain-containing protein 80 [Heterodontus francisci]|uniref:coiled-coil domain-containing protein 80 n=1 Tax=Heterodontus francisci TaxID=7792 RepID=UPI00355B2976
MKGTGLLSLVLLVLLWLLCDCGKPSEMLSLGRRGQLRLLNGSASGAQEPGRTSRPLTPISGSNTAQRVDSRSPPSRSLKLRQRSRIPAPRSRSGMLRDTSRAARSRTVRVPASGIPSLLAGLAGKQRLWVISAPHASDGYYRLMLSLLKDDVYCELAERHIYQLVLFDQEGEVGGKVRKITNEGKILEEPLDAKTVLKLLDFLKLEKGKFSMVLLRKNLQMEETYPYPVRLEAMYEVIDQTPVRKIERLRQKGFVQKCKQAGVEGQVVGPNEEEKKKEEQPRPTPKSENIEVPGPKETRKEKVLEKKITIRRKPIRISLNTHGGSRIIRATLVPTTTTASTTTPTTTSPTTTTITAVTTTMPSTAATDRQAGTSHFTRSHVIFSPSSPRFPKPAVTVETPTRPTTEAHAPAARGGTYRDRHRVVSTTDFSKSHTSKSSKTDRFYPPVPTPETTTASPDYTKEQTSRHKYNRTDKKEGKFRRKGPPVMPTQRKPTKVKPPKSKTRNNKILTNEYENKYDPEKASSANTGQEVEVQRVPRKRGKEQKKHGKLVKSEKKKKPVKNEKTGKKTKSVLKTKPVKEASHNKKPKKTTKKGVFKQPRKFPGTPKSLASILSYFENRRRLILITSPNDKSNMYEQQRDEYLEHVCEMALRKISIITILGPLSNSTIQIDHYQLDNEKPVKDIRHSDLDQGLITELRKEYGITENEFFMVLTDLDMKVKQYYEVPIAMQAVFNLIDTFTTRIKEMEKQKRDGTPCKKEDTPRSLENFLSRFRWRRRLFIISTPTDEEWAYQHQLYALNSQACNLGLRHLAVLKLMGLGIDVGGVLELYPINGTATVDREELSQSLVEDLRNYFQVSPEYFSMLLVGKDGNVKSWYPTPMWNMAIVYDLVDSMQLRRQEMAIQQSLGMRCPEDEYGYSYHGYQDGYHQQGHYGGYHY